MLCRVLFKIDSLCRMLLERCRLYRIDDRLCVPNMKFLLVGNHDEIGYSGVEKCCKLLKKIYWFHKMFLALLLNTQRSVCIVFMPGEA